MFKFVRKGHNHIKAENDLTPLEIKARLGSLSSLRSDFSIEGQLRREPPKRFLRQPLADGVTLYSARRRAETLIVAFAGKSGRVMVPISVFLQMLDDERFDVLLLVDAGKGHFDNGLGDYAGSFLDLTQRLARFAEAGRYGSVMTFGTSMGGLPALRAGRLLGARRAVSIGGRFAWHVARLSTSIGGPAARASRPIKAFDPLCSCVASTAPCIDIFSEGNADDAAHARALTAMLPSCAVIPMPVAEHNLIHRCFELGRLDRFYAAIFDAARQPDAIGLRPLLAEPAAMKAAAEASPSSALSRTAAPAR